jgi:translocation and assembly module TamB
LQLAGTASGNLARLQTRGAMTLNAVSVGELGLDSGKIDFSLERATGRTLPSGDVRLALDGVQAGVRLAQLQATMKLPAAAGQSIAVSASARDSAGRAHRLLADVEQEGEIVTVNARELLLSLPDGNWQLAKPATVRRSGDDYDIQGLTLRKQAQLVSVSGRFSLSGSQALDATIERLSLATLFAYQPKAPDVTGALSARLQIRGTAAAPVIDAGAELVESKIAGQSYEGMRARARYQKQAMAFDAVIAQDKTHTLDVQGSVPLALSWQDGWRAEPRPGMSLRGRSSGLSLAFLNVFKPEAIQNINGELALDLTLRGALDAPAPSGTFQLRNGVLEAKRLGIKLSGITAEGSADAQRVTLAQVVARSGDEGTLAGSGVISLKEFTPESVSLSVKARRWPAIQGERYRATVNGNFKVTGPIKGPRVTGAVEVIDGNIRPDLEALNRTGVSLARDPTIVVVQHRGGKPITAEPSAKNGENNGVALEKLTLDVTVTVPDNFWIRHPNANIELKGKLNVSKNPAADLSVTGMVQVVRGWVGLQGRRFTLTEGTIVFTGGKPSDATVDVTAEYRVNNYLVNAEVTGTAEKPRLALTSQPQLEQSDILSLLLFGKPVADLTTGQQVSLQQSAIDVGAGFAAATVGKAVSEALGLEALGLDLSDISFTGGQVRFGRYVGDRTYLSVAQQVAGERRSEVTVEYQFAPDWRVGATSASEGRSGVDIIWQKRY